MSVYATASQRRRLTLTVSLLALAWASPAFAQQAVPVQEPDQGLDTIIVTAQRQAESLQDVPIAVSAFSAEQLEAQQINTTSSLQFALPNVTFAKSNFTDANLTIRGIGAASVATSGDAGVGIHFNDMPLVAPRLFEIEFYDVERIEVLRGPQGTLFGRNASGGVFNLISKKPTDTLGFEGEGEYGNFNSVRLTGSVNIPLTDTLAARVAGIYVNRDGYTKNLFDNSQIDGRDSYAVRGSLRFRPGKDTTLDLIVSHFSEDSNRSRVQKQLCAREGDPITGGVSLLGCRPDRQGLETVNGNAALANILTSREFITLSVGPTFVPGFIQSQVAAGVPLLQAQQAAQATLANLAFGSLYGVDSFANVPNPSDIRTVNTDFNPTYRAKETIAMGVLSQNIGQFNLRLTGGYQESLVDSRTDFSLAVSNRPSNPAAIPTFSAVFPQAAQRLFGPSGSFNLSEANNNNVGFIGGNINRTSAVPGEYDRSRQFTRQYTGEAILSSEFEGKFNFRLGSIYLDVKADNNFFVAASGLDYASALLGGGTNALASPFFNNETAQFRLKALGLFGETYYQLTDEVKITAGLRYTRDEKFVQDRVTLLNVPIPFGTLDAENALAQITSGTGVRTATGACVFDADASTPNCQQFRAQEVTFKRLTGRFVVDWKPILSFTDDTLVYFSYSRGFKSGGINPPFDPVQFNAPATFRPEAINAFEIGTKNRFADGRVQANISAFYYDYKDFQISRILNRTSFNDNTDAEVYGTEAEFLFRPVPELLVNTTLSYLKTKIKDLSIPDSRDPTAGRSDVVLIKDITNAANCVVAPAAPGVPRAAAEALVNQVNAGISASVAPLQLPGSAPLLRGVAPVPGLNTTGALSICSQLAATIAQTGAPFTINLPVGVTRTPTAGGFAPITDLAILARTGLPEGVAQDLSGNELANSP
jgi:iron complex outermembrane recepter protein